jgi:hypothetical protein
LESIMNELMGDGVMSTIRWALDAMQVAEEEIERASKEHPKNAKRIDATFRKLQPTTVFQEHPVMDVYRYHCKELLRRVVGKEKLAPATRVEVMLGLAGMSLKALLNRDATLLYSRLFEEVFPCSGRTGGTRNDHRQDQWQARRSEGIRRPCGEAG